MNKQRVSVALAAGLLAGGLSVGSASAADLGGNCCADLEERVAELEATTARKGNRKVSLTISGWVGEQVMFWDDGTESNAYVTGLGTTLSSHFKMTGAAQIAPGWQAGYVIHVETQTADPFAVNQFNDDATLNPSVSLLQSYWFLKSDTLGKVSVGKQSQASDNAAILVDGSGSLVPANWLIIEGSGFFVRSNGVNSGVTWGNGLAFCQHTNLGIAADCNGVPLNSVRYDSPTFGGFSLSASWGEDDFWDVAARYAGEFNGIKIALAAAYSHQSEEGGSASTDIFGTPFSVATANLHQDSGYFQIGAYVQHVPTGLFVYGAYGYENNDATNLTTVFNGAVPVVSAIAGSHDDNHWYVKGGLRRRWTPLGHTVMYGEYGQYDDMYNPAFDALALVGVRTDSKVTTWGLGVVQEIDAAAMSLWLTYRNISGDLELSDGVNSLNVPIDDFQVIKFGALINF